ncbi:hypothetical protein [Motilimonas sp. KMU-193]|uniref:hypothetical protein n=1 Tax=Motilimonas sp. KMU-193 TaxID=3388668 RepID=UPI00396AF125
MVKYFAIPVLFALVVAAYVMVSGKHNQASWLGLVIYDVLFYGAPYFLHSVLMWLFKAASQVIHAGFIGISLALLWIASLWLLPSDPSGLPIQWMGYWPLAVVMGLLFMGGQMLLTKLKR